VACDLSHALDGDPLVEPGALGRRPREESSIAPWNDVAARAVNDMTRQRRTGFKTEYLPAHGFDARRHCCFAARLDERCPRAAGYDDHRGFDWTSRRFDAAHAPVLNQELLNLCSCRQAYPSFFNRSGESRDQSPVLDLHVQRKPESGAHARRNAGLQMAGFFACQTLDHESGFALPDVAFVYLLYVLVSESQVKRARFFKLDVYARLFAQGAGEIVVRRAAGAGQLEKCVRAVGLRLRSEHPSGGIRSFSAGVRSAFNQRDATHPAQRQRARDCETDDAAAHDHRVPSLHAP
jgi:hypothetical protein